MVQQDLGQATIVYEDPNEGTVEKQVQNEYVAYFQEHWIIKTDEGRQGKDEVRRIPHHRVYYVDRSVQQFEEEISSLRHQVQSIADEVRQRVMGGGGSGQSGSTGSSGGRGSSGRSGSSGSAGSSGGSGSSSGSGGSGGQQESEPPSQ